MGKFSAGVPEKGAEEQNEDMKDILFCECLRQNHNLIQDVQVLYKHMPYVCSSSSLW
jgi:hypothetical protein